MFLHDVLMHLHPQAERSSAELEARIKLSLNRMPCATSRMVNCSAGVSQTPITKRFNRRSVAQSYEYDHTGLAETLINIALPEAAEVSGPRAQEVLKMIRAGQVAGMIVDEFKNIQASLGDEAAFGYSTLRPTAYM
jgi:hypothetical protein